jgi:UDP-N-acetylglucosamine diphosphorylase / glucose-1-phosphate thymidylyltransferase / UDP-N-acetylgalactosamine diphosphorylase / glucosamine-1-phosphate N-acetyltransferase / galactosamine-1-phosphate N-acetyltransferase
MPYTLSSHISIHSASAWAAWTSKAPWLLTSQLEAVLHTLMTQLSASDFHLDAQRGVAIHRSATVEPQATLKGPLIVGPRCFIANGAYLRGGVWLDADVTVGPGTEVKTSVVFAGSKLAHFNFVGDSVLGSDVNLEAGAVICNVHNDLDDKRVWVRSEAQEMRDTGLTKFGAYVGDGCRIGANAVLAPGTTLRRKTIVPRGAVVSLDYQDPSVLHREFGA